MEEGMGVPTGDQYDLSATDPEGWIAAQYDPLRLAADCSAMLNGPGGALEQTYVYIDGQGAVDWLAYSNNGSYVTNFRNKYPEIPGDLRDCRAQIKKCMETSPSRTRRGSGSHHGQSICAACFELCTGQGHWPNRTGDDKDCHWWDGR